MFSQNCHGGQNELRSLFLQKLQLCFQIILLTQVASYQKALYFTYN